MRNFLLFILGVVVISGCCREENESSECRKDFILAGDSTNNCYQILKIDSIITCSMLSHSVSIDLDGDKVNDIKFVPFYNISAGQWEGNYGYNLSSLHSDVEYLIVDTNYVLLKNLKDTIGVRNKWNSQTPIGLSYRNFGICPPICPGYDDTINFTVNNKFIGIRINKQNYFWIKININDSGKRLIVNSIGKVK